MSRTATIGFSPNAIEVIRSIGVMGGSGYINLSFSEDLADRRRTYPPWRRHRLRSPRGFAAFPKNASPPGSASSVIRSPANSRVASGALGSVSCIKTPIVWVSRRSCFQRLGRIAIERGSVTKRHAHRGLVTFRADEGVDQDAQPLQRRPSRRPRGSRAVTRSSAAIHRSGAGRGSPPCSGNTDTAIRC